MSKIANCFDVQAATSADMVLSMSGTNWEPDVYTAGAIGKSATGPFNAIVNPSNDQILGMVRGRWKANSHVDSIMGLDGLIREGHILPYLVSVWDHGAVVAYQFDVPALDVAIRPGDRVSPLFTLAFWHDGKGGDRAFFADFRWFCKNQMGKVSKASEGSIRHGSTIKERYTALLKDHVSDISADLGDRYDAMRQMTTKSLLGKPMVEYMGGIVGVEKQVIDMTYDAGEGMFAAKLPDSSTISQKRQHTTLCELLDAWDEERECIEHGPDEREAEGTVWTAYNAVTRYLTHKQGRNSAGRAQRMLLGQGSDLANHAFEEAVRIAAA